MNTLRRKNMFAPTPARTWPPALPDEAKEDSYVTSERILQGSGGLDRQMTQEVQDQEDKEKQRAALRDLVESWMDRLQLISVISTFFASTEASLLSISAPDSDGTSLRILAQIANIGIVGSLVIHSSTAIISFLAAFFLVRYKLRIASNEELEILKKAHSGKGKDFDEGKFMVESPTSMKFVQNEMHKDREKGGSLASRKSRFREVEHATDPIPGPIKMHTSSSRRPVWSSNPHIVQVGPFKTNPPAHLLHRCHTLCVFLTALGFVLALTGILCFAWDRLPRSVGISASFCMAMCIISGFYIVIQRDPPEGTSPHIYIFDDL